MSLFLGTWLKKKGNTYVHVEELNIISVLGNLSKERETHLFCTVKLGSFSRNFAKKSRDMGTG